MFDSTFVLEELSACVFFNRFYGDHSHGKRKSKKKPKKTSPLFDDDDKCFGPLSATADSTTLEGHFLPGLYRRVSFFFSFFFFLLLSRGSIRAASQTGRYRRAAADLFSSRLLLLGDLTGAQISGIDFARASAPPPKKKGGCDCCPPQLNSENLPPPLTTQNNTKNCARNNGLQLRLH